MKLKMLLTIIFLCSVSSCQSKKDTLNIKLIDVPYAQN